MENIRNINILIPNHLRRTRNDNNNVRIQNNPILVELFGIRPNLAPQQEIVAHNDNQLFDTPGAEGMQTPIQERRRNMDHLLNAPAPRTRLHQHNLPRNGIVEINQLNPFNGVVPLLNNPLLPFEQPNPIAIRMQHDSNSSTRENSVIRFF